MSPTAASNSPLPASSGGAAASTTTATASVVPTPAKAEYPAARSSRNTSQAARAVTTPTAIGNHGQPRRTTAMSGGTKSAELQARWRSMRSAPEAPGPSRELEERLVEGLGPEIGPQDIAGVELGV